MSQPNHLLVLAVICLGNLAPLAKSLCRSYGTKLKLCVRDRLTGQSWERYHHFPDIFDYLLSTIFGGEYLDFLRGGRRMKIILGQNVRNTKWDYPDGKRRYVPGETFPKTKNHY